MSDVRLRALERALRTTGTVDAEAAVLAERLRLGQLDRGRLALAAYVGNTAAARLVAEPAHELSVVGLSTTRGLRQWTRMTRLVGKREVVGCVEAAARTALMAAAEDGRVTPLGREELEQTLDRVRDFVERGDRDARERLRSQAARRTYWSWWRAEDWLERARLTATSLARAVVEREHAPSMGAAAEALIDARALVGAQADVVDQVVRAELERVALR